MSLDRFMQGLIEINAAFLERRVQERERNDARNDIFFAMRHPDELVIEMTYSKAAGIRTRRVVSPIKNGTGKKFLAVSLPTTPAMVPVCKVLRCAIVFS